MNFLPTEPEEKGIVIVGGGICGLATALALVKKGISDVTVLERSESLRISGAAINIYTNGWLALDQLGVGAELRSKAVSIKAVRDISLSNGKQRVAPLGEGEMRSLKRTDLIEVLADRLPPSIIRYGCHIAAVKLDPLTCRPLVQLEDGSLIKSKVLIGCDGVNSIISKLLGLKATKQFTIRAVRGFTNYPSGHGFSNEFVRMNKGQVLFGRVPVDNNLLYWFVVQPWIISDSRATKDPILTREATIESVNGFPFEVTEIIKNCDVHSLTNERMKYRAPWDLLASFRKGSVTVAGDAMHPMGPFLGQGGSCSFEDAVVLGRNLAQEMSRGHLERNDQQHMQERVYAAIDRYVKERRMRVLRLSTQSYLTGMLLEPISSLTKLVIGVVIILFTRDSLGHTRYDCGRL